MSKWNMIIDVAKCENCNNCVLATKDEHVGNDFPGYAAPQPGRGHYWINLERRVRGQVPMVDVCYLPTMCNHCDHASCVEAAGDGSIYKRADGIVIIDPVKAKGREVLVASCPYGSIWWNDDLKLPQKWIFDAHLLDAGLKEPRCTQACPTGALQAVKVDDASMDRIAAEQGLRSLHPEWGLKPRVHYRNLHRFDRWFLGGTVTTVADGLEECVAGALVTLTSGSDVLGQVRTDSFGDFKFDHLPAERANYRVLVDHAGHAATEHLVEMSESQYIGVITMKAEAAPPSPRP